MDNIYSSVDEIDDIHSAVEELEILKEKLAEQEESYGEVEESVLMQAEGLRVFLCGYGIEVELLWPEKIKETAYEQI